MPTQRLANIVFAVAVIAAAAYFAWYAQGFRAAGLLASSGLPSKFFPQLLLAGIVICAAVVLMTYWIKGSAGGDEGKAVYAAPIEAARGLSTLAAAIVAYAVWRVWGFVPMAAFLGPACCLAMGVRNPYIYLVVLALAGLVHQVFTRLLGTQF